MMKIIMGKNNYHFSGYENCSNIDEDLEEDNTEISSTKLILFFIFIAIMIILIIIITITLLYKLVIKNDIQKSKSKRAKYQEILRSYREKTNVEQYINDCINGVLYDNNKYKLSENPKISVIIPIYNKEKFILRILRSIQNQSFKDIEIIFCDDFSNDNSTKLIEKFQKEDERIILMKHDINKGTLINRGANIAKGEYLLFIDGDDLLVNNILERTYLIAKSKDIDIIQYQHYIGDFYNTFYCSDIKRTDKIIYQPELSSLMYYENGTLHQSEFNVWGKLIKRDIYLETLKKIDKYFLNQNMILHEDGLILFMLFKTAKSYLFIKDYGLLYFSNEYSTMRNLRNKNKINKSTRDSFLYLEYMFKYTNNSLYEKNMAVCQFKFLYDLFQDIFMKTTSGFNYIHKIIDLYLNCNKITKEDKQIIRNIKNQFKQIEQNLKH